MESVRDTLRLPRQGVWVGVRALEEENSLRGI